MSTESSWSYTSADGWCTDITTQRPSVVSTFSAEMQKYAEAESRPAGRAARFGSNPPIMPWGKEHASILASTNSQGLGTMSQGEWRHTRCWLVHKKEGRLDNSLTRNGQPALLAGRDALDEAAAHRCVSNRNEAQVFEQRCHFPCSFRLAAPHSAHAASKMRPRMLSPPL